MLLNVWYIPFLSAQMRVYWIIVTSSLGVANSPSSPSGRLFTNFHMRVLWLHTCYCSPTTTALWRQSLHLTIIVGPQSLCNRTFGDVFVLLVFLCGCSVSKGTCGMWLGYVSSFSLSISCWNVRDTVKSINTFYMNMSLRYDLNDVYCKYHFPAVLLYLCFYWVRRLSPD